MTYGEQEDAEEDQAKLVVREPAELELVELGYVTLGLATFTCGLCTILLFLARLRLIVDVRNPDCDNPRDQREELRHD